jgi:hypothetical protein
MGEKGQNGVVSSEERLPPETSNRRPLPAPATDFVLTPGLQYHNVATLGPVPRCVLQAAHADVLDLQANPHSNYFMASSGSVCEKMDYVRARTHHTCQPSPASTEIL